MRFDKYTTYTYLVILSDSEVKSNIKLQLKRCKIYLQTQTLQIPPSLAISIKHAIQTNVCGDLILTSRHQITRTCTIQNCAI